MLSIFFLLCCVIVHHSWAQFDPTTHENWHLLKNRNCDNEVTSRIVEGENAKVGEFPWMAGLVHKKRTGKKARYLCVGTILNKETILTSANCVTHLPNELHYLIFVVLGDMDKTKTQQCDDKICAPSPQFRYLKEVIYHKGFDSTKHLNDIALLRVKKDIEFNSYVWPICMPRGDLTTSTFIDDEAVVAGWGVTDRTTKITSSGSDTLKKVTLKVQHPNVCKTLDQVNFDPEKQLCVGGHTYGPGPCFGDQGGPLMIVRDLKTYLIGIFSYNGINGKENCGEYENPPVFVRVSAYLEWIMDNLAESKKDFHQVAAFECADTEVWCKLFFSGAE